LVGTRHLALMLGWQRVEVNGGRIRSPLGLKPS
jgi:hypothetical protein